MISYIYILFFYKMRPKQQLPKKSLERFSPSGEKRRETAVLVELKKRRCL